MDKKETKIWTPREDWDLPKIDTANLQDIGQQQPGDQTGTFPSVDAIPLFRTAEDRSFQFALSPYVHEPSDGLVLAVINIYPEDQDLQSGFQSPGSTIFQSAGFLQQIPGEVLEPSDPVIQRYSPPDVGFQTTATGTSGTPGIRGGARFFVAGVAPDLVYSSKYTFKLSFYFMPVGSIFTRLFTFRPYVINRLVSVDIVGAPIWDNINPKIVHEGDSYTEDVKPYVKNEVDRWAITSPATTDNPSPPVVFNMAISDGNVTAMPSVPHTLKETVRYMYTVTATNAVDNNKVQRDNPQSTTQDGEFTIVQDPPKFDDSTTLPLTFEYNEGSDVGVVADINRYLVDPTNDPATRFTARIVSTNPEGAPDLELNMDQLGLLQITGLMPLVDEDTHYKVVITAINDAGQDELVFDIGDRAETPMWGTIADQVTNELETIDLNIYSNSITNFDKAHSDTDPLRYRIRTSAPNRFRLTIRSAGTIHVGPGMIRVPIFSIHGTAPSVNTDEDFDVTVGATNRASGATWAETTFEWEIKQTRSDNPGGGSLPSRWSFAEIPDKFIDEGERIFIPIDQYIDGQPSRYSIDSIRAHNTDAPNISLTGDDRLDINSMGVIIGHGELVNAPDVEKDEPYDITVRIHGNLVTQTDATRTFTLHIRQLGPEAGPIPPTDEDETNPLAYDVSSYFQHDPDTYEISSVSPTRTTGDPSPPVLELNANMEGVVSHPGLPEVTQDEQYRVGVLGTNQAGCDTGFFFLTINQTPPEWRTIPLQQGNEEEDILINLSNFVDKEPEDYQVISVVAVNTTAPDLALSADPNSGLIRKTLPKVDQNEDYTVTVRCSNRAGDADPDATFTLRILNTAPVWQNIRQIDINEGATRTINLSSYIVDTEGVTYEVGTPVLTNSAAHDGLTAPSLTASAADTGGNFTLTAGQVDVDAFYNVPVVARNDAGPTSANLPIRVVNATTDPDFTQCANQTENELSPFSFTLIATHELDVTYSQVSGPSWMDVNQSTGVVSDRTPEVLGTVAANPDDVFTSVYRATVTDAQGTSASSDCTVRMTVVNVDQPPPGTVPSWFRIPDYYGLERRPFSFGIARYARGNPFPDIGERTGAGTPSYVRVASNGQVSGTFPSVGEDVGVATRDGKIWKLTLSTGRPLSETQIVIPSMALPSGTQLLNVIQGVTNQTHFIVFNQAVTGLQRGDFTIGGSPSVTVTNLEQAWYNTNTIYVTARNVVNSQVEFAHQTFNMTAINTDIAEDPPNLNVPDQIVDESTTGWTLDLREYTTGSAPFTYERTLISAGPNRFPLPDWTDGGGTGLTLTEEGILSGDPPSVDDDQVYTVNITAINSAGTSPDTFNITVQDTTVPPPGTFVAPVWNIGNKSVREGLVLTIAPLTNNELSGTPTPTISAADPDNVPIPDWIPLMNNVMTGTAPLVEMDTPIPIALNASNVDTNGVRHTRRADFTITINNYIAPPPMGTVPRIGHIPLRIVDTGTTTTYDVSQYITGDPVPQVRTDPDFTPLEIVPSDNHGTGQIVITVPERRRDYEDLLGRQRMYIIAENSAGSDTGSFVIRVRQRFVNPPRIGTIPAVTMDMSTNYNEQTMMFDNPSTHNDNLGQYLTSMHSIESPEWSKQSTTITGTWQTADWWTVDSQGNLNITAPQVERTTTQILSVVATNPDGHDSGHFALTVNYIPQPPQWQMIPVQTVIERTLIEVDLTEYIRHTFNDTPLVSVTKVRDDAPELFLKTVASPRSSVGIITGSVNVADGTNRIKGTSDLLAAGSTATIDTTSAPQVSRDEDYRVTIIARNSSLVTTPEYPRNSDQTTFTLRIENLIPVTEPPECVQIPLQTSVSGESISMDLRGYFRKTPTSFEIVSVRHVSGFNAGAITLEASNLGVVTRTGGAVAPTVTSEATYSVIIRGINDGGSVDCPFRWRIVPPTPEVEGAPAFVISNFSAGSYRIQEYNPETGDAINPNNSSSRYVLPVSNKGSIYIEGVGENLYGLATSNNELGRIVITPGARPGTGSASTPTYFSWTSIGSLINTSLSGIIGLTSIGTVLYTLGSFANGSVKLFAIDPSTRVASEVSLSNNAINLGKSTNITIGGLTSIGSTIYAIIDEGGETKFVSISTSGGQAGIATDIDTLDETNLAVTSTSLETFGSTVQGLITVIGPATPSIERERGGWSINTTTGALARVPQSVPYGNNQWRSFTQFAISKPTITPIPLQSVFEGFPISFPLTAYIMGADSYRVSSVRPITPGAPTFPIQITANATITGTMEAANAPFVTRDSYYDVTVYAGNSAGEVSQILTVLIFNGLPIWSAIPPQFVDEGQPISFSVARFAANQATSFSLGTITKPRPEAPNLELQINRTGLVTGVGPTVNAPQVDQDERYTIEVTAENTAGPSTTTMTLTIVDLGEEDDRLPSVFRWELPVGAQDGSFEIAIDLTTREYGLCPGSFFYEGIELSGTPFLQWAPVPANDILANRPTKEQRNLDYITSPVPQSGTKYYKLVFPRNILPDILKEGDNISIFLSAHSLRRGRTT